MDLSLAQHGSECPTHSELSVDVVLPILESIVDKDGSAIKHIDLPQTCWTERSCKPQHFERLNNLLQRYNLLLESRGSRCSKCNAKCYDPTYCPWIAHPIDISNELAKQLYTCYKCTKHYCNNPQCSVKICDKCSNCHCTECTSHCDSCGKDNRCSVRCDDTDATVVRISVKNVLGHV